MSNNFQNIVNIIVILVLLSAIVIGAYFYFRRRKRSGETTIGESNLQNSNAKLEKAPPEIASPSAPESLRCGACGAFNPPGNKFCEHCGKSLNFDSD